MGFLGKTNTTSAGKTTPFSLADALPVQTKLTVSKSSDPAEKEADTIARQVVDSQKEKKLNTKRPVSSENIPETGVTEQPPMPEKDGIRTKAEPEKEIRRRNASKDEKDMVNRAELPNEKMDSSKEDGRDDLHVGRKEEKREETVSRKENSPRDIRKKGAENEEVRVSGKNEKQENFASKKDAQPPGITKSGQEREDPAIRRTANNKDRKPVDEEKALGAHPKAIQRKRTDESSLPSIQQRPQEPGHVRRQTDGQTQSPGKEPDAEYNEAKLQAIEEKINTKRGSGRPLPQQVRSEMGQSFGYDFMEVRIHDDRESAELCAALHAQAFAIGNDIFFNTGMYDPESDQGKELLAHELTHVVQQKNTVQRNVVSRKGKASAKKSGIDDASKTITVDKLKLPKLKSRNKGKIGSNVKRPKGYARPSGLAQGDKWIAAVTPQVTSAVEKKIKGVPVDPDTKLYYFGYKKIKFFGSKEKLIANSCIPLWNKAGNANAFDVDHIKEMQLGGTNDPQSNMELLNFSANRSSGSVIKAGIRESVHEFLEKERKANTPNVPSFKNALKNYDIVFNDVDYKLNVSGDGNDFWSYDEIIKGEHLAKFKPLSAKEIEAVKGSPVNPVVYTSEAGGSGLREKDFRALPGLSISGFNFKNPSGSEVTGTISGKVLPNSKIMKPYQFTLKAYQTEGVLHGGHIKRRASGEGSLEKLVSRLEVNGLSPVIVDYVDLIPGKGLVAKGQIKPTVEIIRDLYIDFSIEGDKVELSRTFSAGDLKSIPPPLKVSDATITVFAGSAGVGVRGNIDFEINHVGKGRLKASASAGGGFQLDGKFDFDKKLFGGVDATVDASYKHTGESEDTWDLSGKVRIPKNKIKGIQRVEITVNYQDRIFKADGSAKFDIPGLEDGTLSVTYGNEMLVIEGEANFTHKFIRSGKVKAKVSQVGDETKLSLSGHAKPNIPGIETDLSVSYNEGLLTVSGTVGYKKGRLAGSVTAGVTNQEIGADSKPTGVPGKDLKVFGGGSLSLKVTDWLQGTAGVMFKPDGNVEVVGKIGIPQTVNIFDVKKIEKDIFKAPTVEIPLFAIPVGSRSIGLVATIGGGALAYASIGPGQLTEASVEVQYNPAEEEHMSVTGTAKFRVPAEAGLRLYVRAGIGLSIGIARVAGGLELGGSLGIEGAAEAGVMVNWTPTQGFKLDAEASLYVQPKFKFDVNAYIEAVLDLWIKEFRKEWKWQLYAFEWGPSMRFGVRFPVHYEENKEFNISLDDVRFETPDISVGDFAKGIGKQLIG